MAQYDYGTIDPTTESGTALATALTLERAAAVSNHSGSTRPSYAVAGMIWVNLLSSTQHAIYYFDGAADELLYLVNLSTGVAQAANAAVATVAASVTGGAVTTARQVATTKSLTGGGDLTADRTLQLVNDVTAPGASEYYGTDGSGTKGWNPFPSYRRNQVGRLAWSTAGTYTFTSPAGVGQAWLFIKGGDGDISSGGFYGGVGVGLIPLVAGSTVTVVVGAGAVGGTGGTGGASSVAGVSAAGGSSGATGTVSWPGGTTPYPFGPSMVGLTHAGAVWIEYLDFAP